MKGEAAIDWADRPARAALLAGIVADEDRLLELSRRAQGELPEDHDERQRIVAAAELLGRLLLQDVERTDDGVSLKDGVSRDRMMSVHDPEMRHGHKSSRRRFDGHKAAIVVDTGSQMITAVEALPGNAPDNLEALELVEQRAANTGVPVEEVMGDAAYGDGDTRPAFAVSGPYADSQGAGPPRPETLSERGLPYRPGGGFLHLSGGERYPENPALGYSHRGNGLDAPTEGLPMRWSGLWGVPAAAPVRRRVAAAPGTGQTVQLHPQEALLQQARALQQSEAFAEYRPRRVVVEHRLARPVQLGIRQSRYFGRIKTRFQLYLAATVANLTLVAAKAGRPTPAAVPAPAAPSVPGPSVPHLRSPPRGSARS